LEIAGYSELEEIGRGGYAVVYRARQAAFGRLVAIKVLTNPGYGEIDRARFEREALAMGRLSWHPNIVIVHDTGTTDTGLPFLVEEYLEGGSLGDKLRRTGPFSPAEAVSDLIQLCAAAHTAHEADLLHRDIKPDNALIDTFGRVKLADFGIAAVTGSTLTASGVVTATVAHAAPEVLNGARATYQADVYSLGSTLFELLTGAPAFVRDSDESIVPLVLRVTSDPVPDLAERGVPAPVVEVIESAMAKNPADRPESALALGRRLQSAQQALGLKVTDLSVRGGSAPLHDDTVVGGTPVPPVVAATPPPPPPDAPSSPVAGAVTDPTPAAEELAGATGTVAVPQGVVTPPPGREPRTGPPTTETRSKTPVVLAVLAVLAVAAIAFLLLSGGDDDEGGSGDEARSGDIGSSGSTVGSVDGSSPTTSAAPRGEPSAAALEVATGARPFRLAVTDDAVWVTDSRATTVDRIDVATNRVIETIDIGGEPAGIDSNAAGVWVSNFTAGTVEQIDPDTDQVVATIDVGNGPRNVSATEDSVWVANIDDNTVSHIDVETGAVASNIRVGLGPRGIVATDDEVWVSNVNDGTVSIIDPATNTIVDTVDVGGEPGGIALTTDSAWVTDASTDVVIQIDRDSHATVASIPVGVDPGGTDSTDDTVYVSASGDDQVFVIDADGTVVDQLTTGDKPGGLAVTDTDLWVANTDGNTVSRIAFG
jgi:YVTN family beta-propeller protein